MTTVAPGSAAPPAPPSGGHLLDAVSVTKRFAGIAALHNVTLHVDEGELVGLIGPNGAGKTTFFDCLYGTIHPDRGRVTFAGRHLAYQPEYTRCRLGLGRTFQRIELFAGMSVRDHLVVAGRSRSGRGSIWRDLTGRGGVTEGETAAADALLDRLGLLPDADRPIEALSLGRARLVELGRALMTRPRLLLLDEPSSGLNRVETDALVAVLHDVQRDDGTAILLVEHDVEMVAEVTDRLYVLDLGRVIAEGPTGQVLDEPAVRHAYLGGPGS